MKSFRIPSRLIFFVLWLICSSCVENIVRIDIHPRGSYTVRFTARGDSTDLHDDDFVVPEGMAWKTEKFIEERDDDVNWVLKSRRHVPRGKQLPGIHGPDTLPDDIKLHHPLTVETEDRFFWRRYRFTYTFQGRRVDEKYPGLKQLLDDEETTGWADEVVHHIAREGLNRARERLPGMVSPSTFERIRSSIDSAVSSVAENEEKEDEIEGWMENKENWILGLTEGMEPVPSREFLDQWEYQMNILDKELTITMGLNDDSFKVFTTMPGKLVSGNYDTVSADTMAWEFSLEDFIDDDYIMKAESRLDIPQRSRSLIVVAITALVIGLLLERRRREEKKRSAPL